VDDWFHLYGSNDNVNWTHIDEQPQLTAGVVQYKASFTLGATATSYKYYKAVISTGAGSGTGKVMKITLHKPADQLVCKTAVGYGATSSLAVSNAKAAAVAAAVTELVCLAQAEASAVYTDAGGNSGSGSATSLNGLPEAQLVALANAIAAVGV